MSLRSRDDPSRSSGVLHHGLHDDVGAAVDDGARDDRGRAEAARHGVRVRCPSGVDGVHRRGLDGPGSHVAVERRIQELLEADSEPGKVLGTPPTRKGITTTRSLPPPPSNIPARGAEPERKGTRKASAYGQHAQSEPGEEGESGGCAAGRERPFPPDPLRCHLKGPGERQCQREAENEEAQHEPRSEFRERELPR